MPASVGTKAAQLAAHGRAPSLMFDPSSLLDRRALVEVVELGREEDGGGLFVPASFLRALNEPHLLPDIVRYFGRRGTEVSVPETMEAVRTGGLRAYPREQEIRGEDSVAMRLIRGRGRIVRDILLEEWLFLQGQSWIASKSRRTFTAFTRAGAVFVDFSGQKFDALVARTLHHDRLAFPRPLTRRDRLKAAAKWIAAAGSPFLGLVDPILAAFSSTGTGVFFLFDP